MNPSRVLCGMSCHSPSCQTWPDAPLCRRPSGPKMFRSVSISISEHPRVPSVVSCLLVPPCQPLSPCPSSASAFASFARGHVSICSAFLRVLASLGLRSSTSVSFFLSYAYIYSQTSILVIVMAHRHGCMARRLLPHPHEPNPHLPACRPISQVLSA